MNIAVTGAHGFIGRNLIEHLTRSDKCSVLPIGREDSWSQVATYLEQSQLIFHLAGVNRPTDEAEYAIGNAEFTERICTHLRSRNRSTSIVFSSSIQADLSNAYGASKYAAEQTLSTYAQQSGARVSIYRLPNVFGKWCRPNYNSVVATFCHNISHGIPISISDVSRELQLVYIDDVIRHFLSELTTENQPGLSYASIQPVHQIRLGELAQLLQSFRTSRQTLFTPDFSNPLVHKLYATYLSYLDEHEFGYVLDKRVDQRGCLAEFIKSPHFGQIFVSRTAPGITRGNHFHHTKTEKFMVLEGKAMIRFRPIEGDKTIEYPVQGDEFKVVDIPPGYTHSIENVGENELVTLFWASELFNPQQPDTYAMPVL